MAIENKTKGAWESLRMVYKQKYRTQFIRGKTDKHQSPQFFISLQGNNENIEILYCL